MLSLTLIIPVPPSLQWDRLLSAFLSSRIHNQQPNLPTGFSQRPISAPIYFSKISSLPSSLSLQSSLPHSDSSLLNISSAWSMLASQLKLGSDSTNYFVYLPLNNIFQIPIPTYYILRQDIQSLSHYPNFLCPFILKILLLQ